MYVTLIVVVIWMLGALADYWLLEARLKKDPQKKAILDEGKKSPYVKNILVISMLLFGFPHFITYIAMKVYYFFKIPS